MSPNNPPFNALFNHLLSTVDQIQETFPNAEVVILGVNNNNRLKYLTHTDAAGLIAEALAIAYYLTQSVEELTRILDNVNRPSYILVLFHTSFFVLKFEH